MIRINGSSKNPIRILDEGFKSEGIDKNDFF